MNKKCSKCQKEKLIDNFYNDIRQPSGKYSSCKDCCRKEGQKRYELNREKEKLRTKIYRNKHLEKYRKLSKEYNANERENNIARYILRAAKKRSKQNNLEFFLTEKDIIIPSHCPVLGIELYKGNRKTTDHSPTLDRIDNNNGYVKNNVVVVSHKANRIKNSSSLAELQRVFIFYRDLYANQNST